LEVAHSRASVTWVRCSIKVFQCTDQSVIVQLWAVVTSLCSSDWSNKSVVDLRISTDQLNRMLTALQSP